MRRGLSRFAVVGLAAVLALAGCGRDTAEDGGSGGGGEAQEKGTIGIAMPTKSSERWIADGKNVVEDLKSTATRPSCVYGEDDPDQQVSQIENLITQGVKALIIAAIDNKSMNNVLQQAADAKIPVISYDRLILGTPERRLLRVLRQREGRRAAGPLHRGQARPRGRRQEGPVQHRAVRRLERRQQHQVLLPGRDEASSSRTSTRSSSSSAAARPR